MKKILLMLFLFSSQSFAVDYTWHSFRSGFTASSASSVCEMERAAANVSNVTLANVVVNGTSATCFLSVDGNPWREDGVFRSGDQCPSGKVYDEVKGECKTNKCEALFGQKDWIGTDVPKFEYCKDGCVAALVGDNAGIKTYKKGATEKVYYSLTVQYTGESCENGDSVEAGTTVDPTTSASEKDCEPTTTGADGSKTSSCTNKKTDIDNTGCVAAGGAVGQINGVMTCVASNKGPKATETKETTKETTKTNPDGSSVKTTETTTDTKTCSGAGSCTTSTTTNTTTAQTNADGTPGKQTTDCKGAKCATDGKTPEEGKDEEKEDEGPKGPNKSLGQGEKGSFDQVGTEWDQKIDSVKKELESNVDKYKALFAGVFDLNLTASGGSLMCETIPISFGTYGTGSVRICPRDYSDQLVYLRYALLLVASVIAATIVLRD